VTGVEVGNDIRTLNSWFRLATLIRCTKIDEQRSKLNSTRRWILVPWFGLPPALPKLQSGRCVANSEENRNGTEQGKRVEVYSCFLLDLVTYHRTPAQHKTHV
jgi:hypothetical protein